MFFSVTKINLFGFESKLTKNPRYLDEINQCCEVTWSCGLLTKGYGLCHGVAGNAYSFLDSFQSTGNSKWLHRAWMVIVKLFIYSYI